jgi:hypothetical protein
MADLTPTTTTNLDRYRPIMSVLMPATLLATLLAGILVYRRTRWPAS